MADKTGIAWTDHTENFWYGCTAVSPACDHCYAAALVNGRMGGDFDQRVRTVPANWRKPLSWDRAAKAAGVRRRVFSLSLGDFFDNQVPEEWRTDAWEVIRATPNLDWQILTKRPQNIRKMLPPDWGDGWPNVWLGTTVENQAETRRIRHLREVPAAIRFLSCEPLLGPIAPDLAGISWVICGGESGGRARPTRRAWAEMVRYDCAAESVAFFFKQVGSNRGDDWPAGIAGKGDDLEQFPPELRVREFPA